MSYLYILQHGCLNIIQRFIQNLRPSRLSTRSLQSKIYDPLVSVQGQNEKKKRPSCLSTSHFNLKFTTLSSQYNVKMKKKFNPHDPLVLVQGHFNPKFTTLSSQYKVKMKNNDPLVSVQGQNEEQRPSRLSTRSL